MREGYGESCTLVNGGGFRFEIQYYTCGGSHATLTVDTRARQDAAPDNGASRDQDQVIDVVATPLEKLIHTKFVRLYK